MSGILAEIGDLPKNGIYMNVPIYAASLLMFRFYHAGSPFLRNFMHFQTISFQFIPMNFERNIGPKRRTTKICILTNIELRVESLFIDQF